MPSIHGSTLAPLPVPGVTRIRPPRKLRSLPMHAWDTQFTDVNAVKALLV